MSLRDQSSLRRKLVLMSMLSVGMALLLAVTAFLALEVHDFRTNALRVRWMLAGCVLLTLLIELATLVFAARMSRVITEPILHLVDAARRIAVRRSIGECMLRETRDELGLLVDAFNAMLEQLGERQTRLEESQRLAHLGDWTFDPATRRFEWSEETFRIFGLDSANGPPEYSTFKKLIRADDFKQLEATILGTRMGEETLAGDFQLAQRDGTARWTHITCAWHKDASERDFLRGTVMDITDRKQSEAALLQGQKLESLGVLAGGIAHDFNNLLAALRGNLDLAATDLPKNSVGHRYLAKSGKIIEKAANLTRQLLAYSGKGQFQVKPLDLSQQVREMGHLLSVSVSKKADLRYEITEGLPAIIGDMSQIQQVIMNLVINASEALKDPDGFVLIRTGSEYLNEAELKHSFAGQELSPGPYVALEVQDNGHGMDARTLERIFDPFFTTKFHGRGLGLAAMLGIVKSHKGGIKVTSEVGKGTTFRILFPSSNVFMEMAPPVDPSSGFNRTGKILVVDDEPDIRLAATDIFEHLGFEVLQAADGREGMALVKKYNGRLRMVLLDLTMPRMNGIEFMKALRTIDPFLPVLMTSGFSESDNAAELANLGLSGFLQKPYSLASLKVKMKEILG
jgi:PAS domain S-box-containing protein